MQAIACILVVVTTRPDVDAVFKALADPTRRRLLDSLRQADGQALRELCEDIAMARQSVTQHLDILVAADLVVVIRRGRERRHFLNTQPIHDIERRWIRDFDRPHLDVLHAVEQRAEEIAMSETATRFPTYVYVTYIRASAENVWEALTSADVTAIYWNGMANVSDWKVGSAWTHQVGDGDGRYDIWGKVLESDPPRRLVVTFQPAARDLEDQGSVVTYVIEPADDVVRLTVTHEDLADQATVDGISQGWPTVLSNLKSYLETGQPLPPASWDLASR